MKKEFIPYEQALELKELGFDEPCFGVYINNKLTIEDEWFYATNQETFIESDNFTAPTFSQAFRWFREKYKLEPEIVSDMFGYVGSIVDRNKPIKIQLSPINLFQTYEEAELACLNKLIEIVKQ